MKKLIMLVMTISILTAFNPIELQALSEGNKTSVPLNEPTELESMITRLKEINDMDKSALSSSEKKELRKEVRMIKRKSKDLGRGVYLSGGAIIIIILLVILLV